VVELDGEAGLKAAREIRPDAITLDIDMPGNGRSSYSIA